MQWQLAATVMAVVKIQPSTKKGIKETVMPLLLPLLLPLLSPSQRLTVAVTISAIAFTIFDTDTIAVAIAATAAVGVAITTSCGRCCHRSHCSLLRGSAGNETTSLGIEPGTALLLANANTTKPLRRRNGLVVLAFANTAAIIATANFPIVAATAADSHRHCHRHFFCCPF